MRRCASSHPSITQPVPTFSRAQDDLRIIWSTKRLMPDGVSAGTVTHDPMDIKIKYRVGFSTTNYFITIIILALRYCLHGGLGSSDLHIFFGICLMIADIMYIWALNHWAGEWKKASQSFTSLIWLSIIKLRPFCKCKLNLQSVQT